MCVHMYECVVMYINYSLHLCIFMFILICRHTGSPHLPLGSPSSTTTPQFINIQYYSTSTMTSLNKNFKWHPTQSPLCCRVLYQNPFLIMSRVVFFSPSLIPALSILCKCFNCGKHLKFKSTYGATNEIDPYKDICNKLN